MPRIDDIQLRRGTAAAWAAQNPVLDPGEPGWDTTTPALKIGDGVTAWNALPTFGGGAPTGAAGGALAGTYPNPTLSSADLTAIAALATTAFGRDFLVMANAAAVFTKLGLGTAASQNTGAFDAAGAAAAAQAASQPHNVAVLDALVANGAPGASGLAVLLGATAAAIRTTLGLGTAALVDTGTGAANVPTITQADARYAPFDPATGAGLGTTGTVNLNLATLDQTLQSIGQTGNLTLTTSNLSAGRQVTLYIKNTTGGALTLAYPAWIVVGTALPTSLAAGKTLALSLSVPNGVTTDAASIAAGAVQL